jgi:hypothetical protein
MEEEWRKCDRNEGMEEYVYLAHRRGMMEVQNEGSRTEEEFPNRRREWRR